MTRCAYGPRALRANNRLDRKVTLSLPAAWPSQLQQEMAVKQVQELATKMTEKCFERCAKTSSGDRLSSSEQSCLALCMDRYADTLGEVQKSMMERQNRA